MQRTLSTKAEQHNSLSSFNASDLLSKLINNTIAENIEAFVYSLSEMELEFMKYLNYYFKKFHGNIAIPVKNLMDRFNISKSWVMKVLSRIYGNGLLITTGGGKGRRVTKRTFTERAKLVIKAVVKGFGAVKQDIPNNSTPYCTPYSEADTKYISSKVDIVQGNAYKHFEPEPETQTEITPEKKKELIAMARMALQSCTT